MKKILKVLLVTMILSSLFSFVQVNANSTGVAKTAWFDGDSVILYVNVSNVGETTIVETIFSLGTLHQKGTSFIVGNIDSEEIILPGETYTWVLNWNSSGAPLGVYDLYMVGVVYFDTEESQDIYADEINSFVLVQNGTGDAEVQLYYKFVDLPIVESDYFLGQEVDLCFELNNTGNIPFFPECDFRISPVGESNWTSIGICQEESMSDLGLSSHCYNEEIPGNTTTGLYDWEFHIIGYGGNLIRDYVYKSTEPFELMEPDPDCLYEFSTSSSLITDEIFDIEHVIDNTGNVPYLLEIDFYLMDDTETIYYPELLWEPNQIMYPGLNDFTSYWLLPEDITADSYTGHSTLQLYDDDETDELFWFFDDEIVAPPVQIDVFYPQIEIKGISLTMGDISVGDDMLEMEIDWSLDGNIPCLPVYEISVEQDDTTIFDESFYDLFILSPGTHTLELDIPLPSEIQPGDYTGEVNIRAYGIPDTPPKHILERMAHQPIDVPGIYLLQNPVPTEAEDIEDFVKIIDYNIYWNKAEGMYSFSFNVEQETNSDDTDNNNQVGIPGYPIEAIILSLLIVAYWLNRKQ